MQNVIIKFFDERFSENCRKIHQVYFQLLKFWTLKMLNSNFKAREKFFYKHLRPEHIEMFKGSPGSK